MLSTTPKTCALTHLDVRQRRSLDYVPNCVPFGVLYHLVHRVQLFPSVSQELNLRSHQRDSTTFERVQQWVREVLNKSTPDAGTIDGYSILNN